MRGGDKTKIDDDKDRKNDDRKDRSKYRDNDREKKYVTRRQFVISN